MGNFNDFLARVDTKRKKVIISNQYFVIIITRFKLFSGFMLRKSSVDFLLAQTSIHLKKKKKAKLNINQRKTRDLQDGLNSDVEINC